MTELLEQFLLESREALEVIAQSLLALEQDDQDSARLDELFRLLHTLKGNSGLFDFPDLTRVLHAAEDAMQAVRDGELSFSQALADDLLATADYVSAFIDELQWHGQPSAALVDQAQQLSQALRLWLADQPSAPSAAPAPVVSAEQQALADLPNDAQTALKAAWQAGQKVHWLQYIPAPDCFFQGTDPLHLLRQLDGVIWRKFSTLNPWPELEVLDAYACNLKVELLVTAEVSHLETLFCYSREQVSWVELAAPVTAAPCELDQALALEIIQTQALLLKQHPDAWPSGIQQAALKTFENVLTSLGLTQWLARFQASYKQAQDEASSAPVEQLIEAFLAEPDAVAPTGVAPLTLAADTPAATETELSEAALNTPLAVATEADQQVPPAAAPVIARETALVSAPESAFESKPQDTARRSEEGAGAQKPLKVEPGKIDRLMNLIGEIVVAKNSLPYLAQRAEEDYGQRELAREIKMQYGVINRIAEDLQDAIMQVRMMPVSFVLQRFPRLVRDLSRKLDKQVNLIIEGEDTEADKSMIEALADPLVHLLRNALDHGLETPQARIAAGKEPTGTLRISASQNGDHVSLRVSDDGRGIDPEKIKAKVLEKGLKSAEELDALSPQALLELVFLPGFSTANAISDVSGRGVGMDVVRDAIAKVGGHLSLTSQLGQGTEVSLLLPLSMAVTQVMVVESGGQRYGIAMDQVIETVRLPVSQIYVLKQQPMTLLRGRALPLISLNSLLALDKAQSINEEHEHALMVLRLNGEHLGLIIDEFHGSIEVILKPMSGIIGSLPGYAGTAVMGNGSILMVLNPAELIT